MGPLLIYPSLFWLTSEKIQSCLKVFTQSVLWHVGSMNRVEPVTTFNLDLRKSATHYVICDSGPGAVTSLHVQQHILPYIL